MPDREHGERRRFPTARERKAARIAARKDELRSVAPVLISIPWRTVKAGYSRLAGIASFIRSYEMYAPLLARHKDLLIAARDSGKYEYFDLYASAGGIVVTATDRHGIERVLLEIHDDYWGDEYTPSGPIFTPF